MEFLILLLLFVLIWIINGIYVRIKVKKFEKAHKVCPKCGHALEHDLFDIEVDSSDARIGNVHFGHGVRYYHVMTCPKCYYTIKMEDSKK